MATFDALSYEHVIPLPDLNTDLLLDVQLSLHGAPIPGKWGFPEDVRVYFNSTDITRGVISEPRKVLEAGNDNGRISKQYEAALEGWLLLERTLKDEYPVQSFDKEKATAEELKQQQPASLLSKLGDHAIGFGGALHIFNFLYSQITVEFVSLQKVLLTMFDNFEWQHVFPANLTISQGACRLFEPENFAPIGNTGKAGIGQVVYRIDLLYRNPLENELRELKERVEEIFSIVSSAGPIQTDLAAANTELKHLEAELDISRASIGDENDIKAVNVSLQEIKKALEQPR